MNDQNCAYLIKKFKYYREGVLNLHLTNVGKMRNSCLYRVTLEMSLRSFQILKMTSLPSAC